MSENNLINRKNKSQLIDDLMNENFKLNKKMIEELFAVSIECSTNKSIRAAILTGQG